MRWISLVASLPALADAAFPLLPELNNANITSVAVPLQDTTSVPIDPLPATPTLSVSSLPVVGETTTADLVQESPTTPHDEPATANPPPDSVSTTDTFIDTTTPIESPVGEVPTTTQVEIPATTNPVGETPSTGPAQETPTTSDPPIETSTTDPAQETPTTSEAPVVTPTTDPVEVSPTTTDAPVETTPTTSEELPVDATTTTDAAEETPTTTDDPIGGVPTTSGDETTTDPAEPEPTTTDAESSTADGDALASIPDESKITPDPATVTAKPEETISGVTDNTLHTTTDDDGHETVVPVLFGASCMMFCEHIGSNNGPGGIVLWGVGKYRSNSDCTIQSDMQFRTRTWSLHPPPFTWYHSCAIGCRH